MRGESLLLTLKGLTFVCWIMGKRAPNMRCAFLLSRSPFAAHPSFCQHSYPQIPFKKGLSTMVSCDKMQVRDCWHDLGREKQPWDVLIPGLCFRGQMLQTEIMQWQGLTACNESLCSSAPAQGSMPLHNNSKGCNRREALEFPAWGWGGDKQTSVRMALVHWSCLSFWEDTTSSLEVSSSLRFLMLNLKPCNLPSDCDNKWDLSPSLSRCWTAILNSTHFSAS